MGYLGARYCMPGTGAHCWFRHGCLLGAEMFSSLPLAGVSYAVVRRGRGRC